MKHESSASDETVPRAQKNTSKRVKTEDICSVAEASAAAATVKPESSVADEVALRRNRSGATSKRKRY